MKDNAEAMPYVRHRNTTKRMRKNKIASLHPEILTIIKKINFIITIAITNICRIFVCNNTSHASHSNSAPGLVFDFTGLP